MSNFTFGHNVFKSCPLLLRQNASADRKGLINPFSAKGNIEVFANNTDSGESARNELSHLKSALFAF